MPTELSILSHARNRPVRTRRLPRLRTALRRAFARRPPPIVRAVRAESLTYLDEAALCDLFAAVARVDRAGEPGVLIEVGWLSTGITTLTSCSGITAAGRWAAS